MAARVSPTPDAPSRRATAALPDTLEPSVGLRKGEKSHHDREGPVRFRSEILRLPKKVLGPSVGNYTSLLLSFVYVKRVSSLQLGSAIGTT